MTDNCSQGQALVQGTCIQCKDSSKGVPFCATCKYNEATKVIQCTKCDEGYRFLSTLQSNTCVQSSIFNLSGTEFTFLALFGVALAFALIILSIWIASWSRQRRAFKAARLQNKSQYVNSKSSAAFSEGRDYGRHTRAQTQYYQFTRL